MSDNLDLSRFNPVWQDAIFGWMIKDDAFFDKCRVQVKATWFTDPSTTELVNLMYSFHERYSRSSTDSELVGFIHKKHTDRQTQVKYETKLLECLTRTANVGLDVVQTEMTEWIKKCLLKNGIETVVSAYNKKEDISDIELKLVQVQDRVREVGFSDNEDEVRFGDPIAFFANLKKLDSDRCTLGHPDLDFAVASDARCTDVPVTRTAFTDHWVDSTRLTKGSLAKGDTTLLIGSTNTGKTRTMVAVACANIAIGKHVLFAAHEQQAEQIKELFYLCLTGLTSAQVSQLEKNPIYAAQINMADQLIQEYVTYVHHSKIGNYVEDIIGILQSKNKTRQKRYGKGYDLIIDDYPGKLSLRSAIGQKSDPYVSQKTIYNSFVELGNVTKAHVLLAAQLNREGTKRIKNEKKLADLDSISGSFGIPQDMANVITITRVNNGTNDSLIYYVAKTRSNRQHYQFITQARLDICRPFNPTSQAAQFADASVSVDSLLSAFNTTIARSLCGGADVNSMITSNVKTYSPVINEQTVTVINAEFTESTPSGPVLKDGATESDYYAPQNASGDQTELGPNYGGEPPTIESILRRPHELK